MGDMVPASTLRTLERATRKSLEDCLGIRAANISVEAIRKDNVTAEISIGGPYDVLAPLLKKLGYAVDHSMTFEIVVPVDEPAPQSEPVLPCPEPSSVAASSDPVPQAT
jgi:hypothetical protein